VLDDIYTCLRSPSLAEPREEGGSGRVRTPTFENMGLVICPNLHRNRMG